MGARSRRNLDPLDPRKSRAAPRPAQQGIHGLFGTLHHGLHRSIIPQARRMHRL
jgi:hypothetical protein